MPGNCIPFFLLSKLYLPSVTTKALFTSFKPGLQMSCVACLYNEVYTLGSQRLSSSIGNSIIYTTY